MLERAASKGHVPAAQSRLGMLVLDERHGVKFDGPRAFRLLKAAAEAGDAEGCYGLSECYRHGHGVTRSLADAKRWRDAAAAARYGPALAESHEEILGLQSDGNFLTRAA